MSFKLVPDEPVGEGIRRLAGEQIDSALRAIAKGDPGAPETVHAIRKRCKKVRGLLRLAHGPLSETDLYREENDAFRNAARGLSAARNADVLLVTCDALSEWSTDDMSRRAIAPIRARLGAYRDRLRAATVADQPGQPDETIRFLQRARQRVASWKIDAGGFTVIRPGLMRTYGAACAARRRAAALPAAELLHEWRKHVKYHRIQMRLLQRVTDPSTIERRKAAAVLGVVLGDDHDLFELRRRVSIDHETFGGIAERWTFVSLIDRRRHGLQTEAFVWGESLFAEKPKAFVKRIASQWTGVAA